ncbi:hypothetical protein M5K25_010912 [Dendrobium thyrsiflorum]|uniref:Uncharacterized protein n=1 Tax=Dendrobium thyrsiflorum TaxID=117978 RepID=A0ABD0V8P9_DENTH
MNSRSPSSRRVTKASAVRAPASKVTPLSQTPFSTRIAASMRPNSSSPSFPIKAARPPMRDMAIATFAGAPPAALMNPGASASDTPETVGTKSISISPKLTTRPLPTPSPNAIVACRERSGERSHLSERGWPASENM